MTSRTEKRKNDAENDKPRSHFLVRKERTRDAKESRLIAYDLETTNIGKGTPRPLYLTAYSEDADFIVDTRINSIEHLQALLVEHFLTEKMLGSMFIGWNANHFDSYFVAAALLQTTGYVLRPFLTRSKSLRGMLVIPERSYDPDAPRTRAKGWYFLDGIAMTGLVGVSLEKFLKTFAPDFQKMKAAIDFEKESFDPDNAAHRAYAFRDSEGLYYGMRNAENILLQYFNEPLRVTMGGACIRIFQANIPERTRVDSLPDDVNSIVRDYVMRGGFCWCVDRYDGPVWKYDINQAYAAAMRDAKLPAGRAMRSPTINRFAPVYMVRVTARSACNRIPFYYKTLVSNRTRAVFGVNEIADTWITSIEYEQLRAERWSITVHESIAFEDSFDMRDYVKKLEHIRRNCEGGPKGAIGTMVKAVGNHSYGKTVEELDGLELILSRECPPGFAEYFPEEGEEIFFSHVWYRQGEAQTRPYHHPHIGAFITAFVRMQVRRAALIDPDAWLYADTDCVMFARDVTAELDIDEARYGAWKIEEQGTPYRVIAKKVYASHDGETKHAKGLNVRRLAVADFEKWYAGEIPVQTQTQRQNFVKVMAGRDMYRELKRRGTAIDRKR
jgi:hypothetical protein